SVTDQLAAGGYAALALNTMARPAWSACLGRGA
ncbi:MAG: hypothetical protein RLZZ374_1813, partial [Cyanobacteriota bacterium]